MKGEQNEKKIIILLTVCMLMNQPINICASTEVKAEESVRVEVVNNDVIHEQIINKAIQVFPEYEKQIRGESDIKLNHAKSRTIHEDEIVVCETRKLSDDEVMTYTQYRSGVSTVAFAYSVGKKGTVVSENGTSLVYRMNAWLHHSLSDDVLIVSNIELLINYYNYDKIKKIGNLSGTATLYGKSNMTETASKPAYAEYIGNFSYDLSDIHEALLYPYIDTQTLRIELKNNEWTISSY